MHARFAAKAKSCCDGKRPRKTFSRAMGKKLPDKVLWRSCTCSVKKLKI